MSRVGRLAATAVAWVGVVGVAVSGCGDRALKASGEACSASSECVPGLLCDFGQSPPICAGNSTVADASPPGPDGPPVPDADPALPDAPPVPDATPDEPDAALPDAAQPDAAL